MAVRILLEKNMCDKDNPLTSGCLEEMRVAFPDFPINIKTAGDFWAWLDTSPGLRQSRLQALDHLQTKRRAAKGWDFPQFEKIEKSLIFIFLNEDQKSQVMQIHDEKEKRVLTRRFFDAFVAEVERDQ